VNSCVGTCDLNITVKITLIDRKNLYSQDISLQIEFVFVARMQLTGNYSSN
jgi:hypothetical protein